MNSVGKYTASGLRLNLKLERLFGRPKSPAAFEAMENDRFVGCRIKVFRPQLSAASAFLSI